MAAEIAFPPRTYKRFEDLPVWQEAARLYDLADDFLEDPPRRLRAAFRNQFERAVLSVSNNIAEGFERGTTNELLAFIYIARGSAGGGAFDALFAQSARMDARIQTTDRETNLHRGELLTSITRLGRFIAKLGYQRATAFE